MSYYEHLNFSSSGYSWGSFLEAGHGIQCDRLSEAGTMRQTTTNHRKLKGDIKAAAAFHLFDSSL